MLSQNARVLIEASVPVLREHGAAITSCFYRKMFAAHPELKRSEERRVGKECRL